MVVNTKDVVIKGKSVVQKFVLEFGSPFPQEVFCAKGNGVVLTGRIAKEVVSRKLYANLKNIPKTR